MAWKFKNKQIIVNSDFDINQNKLINVTDPTDNQDAATKSYVDTEISGISTTWYLRDSSDTEASVSSNDYLKFSQSTTIQTLFTDSTNGTTSDPLEITFSVRSDSIGATQLNVSGNGTSGQILSSNGSGGFNWIDNQAGTITSITAGNGMDFTEITTSGSIIMGTPSDITSNSTSSLTTTSHSHYIDASTMVTGNDGIIVSNDNQFQLDSTYVIDSVIPGLTEVTGVTSNTDLGTISSGLTLGMVYIENTGSTTAYINLGTTTTGNEINPYGLIEISPGNLTSITVNKRLSNTQTEHIYISSSDWTNVELNVEWAEITYKNQSNEIDPSALPIATESRLGGVKIGNNINVTGDGTISIDDPILSLSGLTDTSISSPQNDQVLLYSNGNWINGDAVTSLSGLTDTDINTPQTNQVLTYSGGTWVNGDAVTSLVDLTDTNISAPQESQILVYSGDTWVNSDAGGSGGFLGTVTKDSAEPTDLYENQWVQPEPQVDGTFNYTFDNFLDSGSLPISVNLSIENVKLRYDANGYWVKESFNKPLSDSTTWVGTTNNEVEEVPVIDEWVTDESSLTYIGQKYAYNTQTLFVTDLETITTLQNYIFVENINLGTTGNNTLLTIPTGKKLIINNIKLVMNNTIADSFTFNIGNNSANYDNIINAQVFSNVNTDDIFDLNIYQGEDRSSFLLSQTNGSNLVLRVTTATSSTLTANVLIDGFIY